MHLCAKLANRISGLDAVVFAVLGNIEVGLVYARTLKAWIIVGKDLAHFLGLRRVLFEIQRKRDELRTQLLRDKAGHAASTPKLPRVIIAGRQNAFADGEWNGLELRPIELFNSCVEGITVDVDYMLRQIAGRF